MIFGLDKRRKDNRNRLMGHGPPMVAALCICLSACGGAVSDLGSIVGNIDTGSVTTTGFFRDSNVSGLSYQSGSATGVTALGNDTTIPGSYSYSIGNTITFSLGGVTLGTALGAAFITPMSLVQNGATTTTEVQNITRFLMMLDNNNKPEDGITISQNVQAMAQTWQQIDFAAVDFDTALTGIISDVASADSRAPVLPDQLAAITHLEGTLRCSYAGAFGGIYFDNQGVSQGSYGFVINPLTGGPDGYVYRVSDGGIFRLSSATPLSFDQGASALQVVAVDSAGDRFTFQFADPAASIITGNWISGDLNTQGTLNGTRADTAQTPSYLFVGVYGGNEIGVFSFGVYGANLDNVSGWLFRIVANQTYSFNGSLTGTGDPRAIDASSAANNDVKNFSGLLSMKDGTMSGTWTSVVTNNYKGTFSGNGCRLN